MQLGKSEVFSKRENVTIVNIAFTGRVLLCWLPVIVLWLPCINFVLSDIRSDVIIVFIINVKYIDLLYSIIVMILYKEWYAQIQAL
jgi:hypothetical protein